MITKWSTTLSTESIKWSKSFDFWDNILIVHCVNYIVQLNILNDNYSILNMGVSDIISYFSGGIV